MKVEITVESYIHLCVNAVKAIAFAGCVSYELGKSTRKALHTFGDSHYCGINTWFNGELARYLWSKLSTPPSDALESTETPLPASTATVPPDSASVTHSEVTPATEAYNPISEDPNEMTINDPNRTNPNPDDAENRLDDPSRRVCDDPTFWEHMDKPYSGMNLTMRRQLLKKHGVKGYSKMSKADVEAKLKEIYD